MRRMFKDSQSHTNTTLNASHSKRVERFLGLVECTTTNGFSLGRLPFAFKGLVQAAEDDISLRGKCLVREIGRHAERGQFATNSVRGIGKMGEGWSCVRWRENILKLGKIGKEGEREKEIRGAEGKEKKSRWNMGYINRKEIQRRKGGKRRPTSR